MDKSDDGNSRNEPGRQLAETSLASLVEIRDCGAASEVTRGVGGFFYEQATAPFLFFGT